MPANDPGNPLLTKKYRYQQLPEQNDSNSYNQRYEARILSVKKRYLNVSQETTPKHRKPLFPLKLGTPKTQEFGVFGTLFRPSQERQKLKFLVPAQKRAFTPALRTSANLTNAFQTPTQNNSTRGKNPKLWSSSDNPYRHKVYKALSPLRNVQHVVVPSQPNYQKKMSTGESPKVDTQSSLPHSFENSETISNSKKPYKLPQRVIPKLDGPQQSNRTKGPPTSYLLNRSLDLKSTQPKSNLYKKNRKEVLEFDSKDEKALRLSQKRFKKLGMVNQSMDAESQARKKSARRRSQLGPLLDLGKKLQQISDEKRLRSSHSNRSKSSRRSLSHSNGFYNYDSEDRDLGSCKNSKTSLRYSLDEIDPPSDDELSFLNSCKKFYEKKLYNPQRAKSYLNESIALKNELHSMINSESTKFKQKLQDTPQSRKPIVLMPLEKQSEESRYMSTYGADLL